MRHRGLVESSHRRVESPQSITLVRNAGATGMAEFKVPITPFEQWTVTTAFDTDHDGQVRANLLGFADHGKPGLRAMHRRAYGYGTTSNYSRGQRWGVPPIWVLYVMRMWG